MTANKTLEEIIGNLLGEFHEHKCVSCNGSGCINCRKTGYEQTPCKICDKDGIAFKNRQEAIAQIEAHYIPNEAVIRAIGEDEIDKSGTGTRFIIPFERNQLRRKIRKALKLDES